MYSSKTKIFEENDSWAHMALVFACKGHSSWTLFGNIPRYPMFRFHDGKELRKDGKDIHEINLTRFSMVVSGSPKRW